MVSSSGGPAGAIEIDADHAVGAREGVLLVVWRHETRAAAVMRVSRSLKELGARTPGGVGLLQVVEPTAPAPGPDARRALTLLLKGGKGIVVCSAVAYLGTGVKMAAARAFISGLGLLSRPAFPHVIFPTVIAAAEWESERLEEAASRTIAPATLVAAANELTGAIDAGRTMSSKDV